MWKSEEVCISKFMYNYQKYAENSIELSDEFEKNILLLPGNKGLNKECSNLQVQLLIVAKALNKLENNYCAHSLTVGNLVRCLRK